MKRGRDLAVSFDPRCRKHTYRTVAAYESVNKAEKDTDAAEHDAFAELEDAMYLSRIKLNTQKREINESTCQSAADSRCD